MGSRRMIRILFVCKKRGGPSYAGSGTYGLFNSASFVVDKLNTVPEKYHAGIVEAVDDNDIDRVVHAVKPDVVVIEAIWARPEKLLELSKLPKYKNVKWVVRVHSKATFLANEGIAIDWMWKYSAIKNVVVTVNNYEFYKDMLAVGLPVEYLPNVYFAEYGLSRKERQCSEWIDVGCFGSLRPMKNHLNQAIAAIIFAKIIGKKLRFHINSTRMEQKGENVLKNLKGLFNNTENTQLVEHDWKPHYDFCKLVTQMDIGMQVSLSESFNIVTADFVHLGVPMVTSPEIKFTPYIFSANPVEVDEIVLALLTAWYGDYINLQYLSKMKLNFDIYCSFSRWEDFLAVKKHC